MSKNFSVGRSPDVLSDMDAIAETARNCSSLNNDEIKSLIKNVDEVRPKLIHHAFSGTGPTWIRVQSLRSIEFFSKIYDCYQQLEAKILQEQGAFASLLLTIRDARSRIVDEMRELGRKLLKENDPTTLREPTKNLNQFFEEKKLEKQANFYYLSYWNEEQKKRVYIGEKADRTRLLKIYDILKARSQAGGPDKSTVEPDLTSLVKKYPQCPISVLCCLMDNIRTNKFTIAERYKEELERLMSTVGAENLKDLQKNFDLAKAKLAKKPEIKPEIKVPDVKRSAPLPAMRGSNTPGLTTVRRDEEKKEIAEILSLIEQKMEGRGSDLELTHLQKLADYVKKNQPSENSTLAEKENFESTLVTPLAAAHLARAEYIATTVILLSYYKNDGDTINPLNRIENTILKNHLGALPRKLGDQIKERNDILKMISCASPPDKDQKKSLPPVSDKDRKELPFPEVKVKPQIAFKKPLTILRDLYKEAKIQGENQQEQLEALCGTLIRDTRSLDERSNFYTVVRTAMANLESISNVDFSSLDAENRYAALCLINIFVKISNKLAWAWLVSAPSQGLPSNVLLAYKQVIEFCLPLKERISINLRKISLVGAGLNLYSQQRQIEGETALTDELLNRANEAIKSTSELTNHEVGQGLLNQLREYFKTATMLQIARISEEKKEEVKEKFTEHSFRIQSPEPERKEMVLKEKKEEVKDRFVDPSLGSPSTILKEILDKSSAIIGISGAKLNDLDNLLNKIDDSLDLLDRGIKILPRLQSGISQLQQLPSIDYSIIERGEKEATIAIIEYWVAFSKKIVRLLWDSKNPDFFDKIAEIGADLIQNGPIILEKLNQPKSRYSTTAVLEGHISEVYAIAIDLYAEISKESTSHPKAAQILQPIIDLPLAKLHLKQVLAATKRKRKSIQEGLISLSDDIVELKPFFMELPKVIGRARSEDTEVAIALCKNTYLLGKSCLSKLMERSYSDSRQVGAAIEEIIQSQKQTEKELNSIYLALLKEGKTSSFPASISKFCAREQITLEAAKTHAPPVSEKEEEKVPEHNQELLVRREEEEEEEDEEEITLEAPEMHASSVLEQEQQERKVPEREQEQEPLVERKASGQPPAPPNYIFNIYGSLFTDTYKQILNNPNSAFMLVLKQLAQDINKNPEFYKPYLDILHLLLGCCMKEPNKILNKLFPHTIILTPLVIFGKSYRISDVSEAQSSFRQFSVSCLQPEDSKITEEQRLLIITAKFWMGSSEVLGVKPTERKECWQDPWRKILNNQDQNQDSFQPGYITNDIFSLLMFLNSFCKDQNRCSILEIIRDALLSLIQHLESKDASGDGEPITLVLQTEKHEKTVAESKKSSSKSQLKSQLKSSSVNDNKIESESLGDVRDPVNLELMSIPVYAYYCGPRQLFITEETYLHLVKKSSRLGYIKCPTTTQWISTNTIQKITSQSEFLNLLLTASVRELASTLIEDIRKTQNWLNQNKRGPNSPTFDPASSIPIVTSGEALLYRLELLLSFSNLTLALNPCIKSIAEVLLFTGQCMPTLLKSSSYCIQMVGTEVSSFFKKMQCNQTIVQLICNLSGSEVDWARIHETWNMKTNEINPITVDALRRQFSRCSDSITKSIISLLLNIISEKNKKFYLEVDEIAPKLLGLATNTVESKGTPEEKEMQLTGLFSLVDHLDKETDSNYLTPLKDYCFDKLFTNDKHSQYKLEISKIVNDDIAPEINTVIHKLLIQIYSNLKSIKHPAAENFQLKNAISFGDAVFYQFNRKAMHTFLTELLEEKIDRSNVLLLNLVKLLQKFFSSPLNYSNPTAILNDCLDVLCIAVDSEKISDMDLAAAIVQSIRLASDDDFFRKKCAKYIYKYYQTVDLCPKQRGIIYNNLWHLGFVSISKRSLGDSVPPISENLITLEQAWEDCKERKEESVDSKYSLVLNTMRSERKTVEEKNKETITLLLQSLNEKSKSDEKPDKSKETIAVIVGITSKEQSNEIARFLENLKKNPPLSKEACKVRQEASVRRLRKEYEKNIRAALKEAGCQQTADIEKLIGLVLNVLINNYKRSLYVNERAYIKIQSLGYEECEISMSKPHKVVDIIQRRIEAGAKLSGIKIINQLAAEGNSKAQRMLYIEAAGKGKDYPKETIAAIGEILKKFFHEVQTDDPVLKELLSGFKSDNPITPLTIQLAMLYLEMGINGVPKNRELASRCCRFLLENGDDSSLAINFWWESRTPNTNVFCFIKLATISLERDDCKAASGYAEQAIENLDALETPTFAALVDLSFLLPQITKKTASPLLEAKLPPIRVKLQHMEQTRQLKYDVFLAKHCFLGVGIEKDGTKARAYLKEALLYLFCHDGEIPWFLKILKDLWGLNVTQISNVKDWIGKKDIESISDCILRKTVQVDSSFFATRAKTEPASAEPVASEDKPQELHTLATTLVLRSGQ